MAWPQKLLWLAGAENLFQDKNLSQNIKHEHDYLEIFQDMMQNPLHTHTHTNNKIPIINKVMWGGGGTSEGGLGGPPSEYVE